MKETIKKIVVSKFSTKNKNNVGAGQCACPGFVRQVRHSEAVAEEGSRKL